MRIEFSSTHARNAVDRWVSQYGKRGDASKDRITDALLALTDEQRTATAIARIIGNQSWTHIMCVECGAYVEAAIVLGEDPSVNVCLSCLKGAAAAVEAAASALAQLGGPRA